MVLFRRTASLLSPSRAVGPATTRISPEASVAPPTRLPTAEDCTILADFLRRHGHGLVAITGAGISTDSGIPDYRGVGRPEYRPMQHGDYVASYSVRQRYWVRASLAFERFNALRPNDGHKSLSALERAGLLQHLITQNVDRLHHSAGSKCILELHGTVHEVECLSCGQRTERAHEHARIRAANCSWWDLHCDDAIQDYMREPRNVERPDGDRVVAEEAYGSFKVPPCGACGGVLKPAVTFFGGSVPREDADAATSIVTGASALLVLGSTLSTWSAFRLARALKERDERLPLCVVNTGPTRADQLLGTASDDVKIEASLSPLLVEASRLALAA